MKKGFGILVAALALVFATAYASNFFVTTYTQTAHIRTELQLDNDATYIDGGDGLRGSNSFTGSAIVDTVVDTDIASGDFVVAIATGNVDSLAALSARVVEDTIFFYRSANGSGDSTALEFGMSYNWIKVN